MTFKLLPIATLALTLASGAALAQTTTESDTTDSSGADRQRSVSNPEIVGPLYLDSEMTKMRTPEEIKMEWHKMPAEKRKQVQEDCRDPQSPREQDLCGIVTGLD